MAVLVLLGVWLKIRQLPHKRRCYDQTSCCVSFRGDRRPKMYPGAVGLDENSHLVLFPSFSRYITSCAISATCPHVTIYCRSVENTHCTYYCRVLTPIPASIAKIRQLNTNKEGGSGPNQMAWRTYHTECTKGTIYIANAVSEPIGMQCR
jgi:hypothetical protein